MPFHERDIDVDTLSLDVVRIADDCRFRDRLVSDQCAFDLGRSHAMAGHVEHVIDAPGDPVVAVFVSACAVAREVAALEGAEIGLNESFVVTIDRAHLAGPAVENDQQA